MTGSIFDKTARREVGITKQQDLTDTIRVLKRHRVIITTATVQAKRRVWQASPKYSGGDIYVRAALQARFDNENAARRSVEDLQRELSAVKDDASLFETPTDVPDDGSLIRSLKGRSKRG